MAEVRNNFMSSKMNKDLEQRLVPNNEYRDARNVMISKSDGDDVGSLENVLGNFKITDFGYTTKCTVEVVGYFMDVANNRVFVFLTNYTDASPDTLSNFASPSSIHSIQLIQLDTLNIVKLIEGYFLNFSKSNPINFVNLVEDYLYFTDNRNQPRKINIRLANPSDVPSPTYYTCEDQISVAKYYPYESPLLIDNAIVKVIPSNAGNANDYLVNEVYYLRAYNNKGRGAKIRVLSIDGNTQLIDQFEVISIGVGYEDQSFCYLTNSRDSTVAQGTATFQLIVSAQSTLQDRVTPKLPDGVADNPFYDANYEGDKDFLQDKFVRFAWRFKNADNEYSLISPFTQAAFVPQQDGYFVTNAQEKRTFATTELEFMVNKVNYVRVVIKSPYKTWGEAINRFKIKEIDIIFKQSNLSSLNVVESLKIDSELILDYADQEVLLYEYLSQKPYKTLPTKDLTRVYDKIPVRAATQEFVEDAIAYGNYLDKHTPPSNIPYFVSASSKLKYDQSIVDPQGRPTNVVSGSNLTRVEYQNHTLKQNRNYQVGVVLSDRYGRQSTVLLSADNKANTIYHPYKNGQNYNVDGLVENASNFSQFSSGVTGDYLLTAFDSQSSPEVPYDTWPGDSLKITFLDQIKSTFNSTSGTPGLYAGDGTVLSINIISPGSAMQPSSYPLNSSTGEGLIVSTTVTNGLVTGVVIENPGESYQVGDEFIIPGGGEDALVLQVGNLVTPNPTGWYSYKVVVKQQENEYYNVYTPGILSGYIDGEGPNAGILLSGVSQTSGDYISNLSGATLDDPTFHVQLFGDNINKVPRDLSQVGPTQSKFRTGRPTVSADPDYYSFIDPTDAGKTFSADPYDVDDQIRLKSRDRARDLDAGSVLTNSSVKLIPRVVNYTGPMGGTGGFQTSTEQVGERPSNTVLTPKDTTFANLYGQFNKQWYPGERVLEITTIGTSTELGLWDVSANPPFNEAYSFYNFQDNPLMAKGEIQLNSELSVEDQQKELSYLGVRGPSPFAGKVTYEVFKGNFLTNNLEYVGNTPGNSYGKDYIRGTKNVGIIYYSYEDTRLKDAVTPRPYDAPYNYLSQYPSPTTAIAPSEPTGVSGPRPTSQYGLLGSKGVGLLINIDNIYRLRVTPPSDEADTGTLQFSDNITQYRKASISVSNSNGENGVKGYNIYGFPWHLQKILTQQENATAGLSTSTYGHVGTNYQYNFAAKVKSGNAEGATYMTVKLNPNPGNMNPQLAILETEPIVSKLDIYWETSTSGLISELNTAILEEDEFAPQDLLTDPGGTIPEDTTPLSPIEGVGMWDGDLVISGPNPCANGGASWGGPVQGNTADATANAVTGTGMRYAQDGPSTNQGYDTTPGCVPTWNRNDNGGAGGFNNGTYNAIPQPLRYPEPIVKNLRSITSGGVNIDFVDASIAVAGDPTIKLLSYTDFNGTTTLIPGDCSSAPMFALANVNGTTNVYLNHSTWHKSDDLENTFSFTFETITRSSSYAIDGSMDTNTWILNNGGAGYTISNKFPDIQVETGRDGNMGTGTPSTLYPAWDTQVYCQEGGSSSTSFGGFTQYKLGGPGNNPNVFINQYFQGERCVFLGDFYISKWTTASNWKPTGNQNLPNFNNGLICTMKFFNGSKKYDFAVCNFTGDWAQAEWRHVSDGAPGAVSGLCNSSSSKTSSPSSTIASIPTVVNGNEVGMTNSALLPKLYKRTGAGGAYTYTACDVAEYDVLSNVQTNQAYASGNVLSVKIPETSNILDTSGRFPTANHGPGRYELWAGNPGFTNGSTPTMKVYDSDGTSFTPLVGKDQASVEYKYLWFNINL